MAIGKSIREALDNASESVMEMDLLTHALMDMADGRDPKILSIYSRHVWRLVEQMEHLESVLRRDALPILDDFSAVRA